jgi:hypothetical protein
VCNQCSRMPKRVWAWHTDAGVFQHPRDLANQLSSALDTGQIQSIYRVRQAATISVLFRM